MKKVFLIALTGIILFSSYLYAAKPPATPAQVRQNRISFVCPATEPTWTCTATGDTACSIEDIKTMLNFGNAEQVVKIAEDWAAEKNKKDPDNAPWYPYEYFSQKFGSNYIAGALKTSAGCTPLHYVAVRKCFTGDKSVIDNKHQVKAIETMMTWGVDSGKNSKHSYVDPFPFNSACQFAGLHNASAAGGPTVEIPATIGYLASENLNPNIIQAMSNLFNRAKGDTDGCRRGKYKVVPANKYQVFIKELETGSAVGHVGDAQGPKYFTKAKYNSLPVSGYDRVCVADFYNSFGNSHNDQRGPSFTAFDQRIGSMSVQWDKDEKNVFGFKKKIQLVQTGTHFVESFGNAIAYGIPIFKRYEDNIYREPTNTIILNKVENMDKNTRLAAATMLNILSDKLKINDELDVAAINKYQDSKYNVAFKKDNIDYYPTEQALADSGAVVAACTRDSCNYVSANVKKLMQVELTLDKADTAKVNNDLETVYPSMTPYTNAEQDKM